MEFTPLERAVLADICKMHPSERAELEGQLATAKVVSRENTGAGFYTKFSVDRTASAAIRSNSPMDGPKARIDGIEHGMGFLLWLEDGQADCLEGYSYGTDTTLIAFETVGFDLR